MIAMSGRYGVIAMIWLGQKKEHKKRNKSINCLSKVMLILLCNYHCTCACISMIANLGHR
jgi:hypothetical protein